MQHLRQKLVALAGQVNRAKPVQRELLWLSTLGAEPPGLARFTLLA
jgi:hypothetical protein